MQIQQIACQLHKSKYKESVVNKKYEVILTIDFKKKKKKIFFLLLSFLLFFPTFRYVLRLLTSVKQSLPKDPQILKILNIWCNPLKKKKKKKREEEEEEM